MEAYANACASARTACIFEILAALEPLANGDEASRRDGQPDTLPIRNAIRLAPVEYYSARTAAASSSLNDFREPSPDSLLSPEDIRHVVTALRALRTEEELEKRFSSGGGPLRILDLSGSVGGATLHVNGFRDLIAAFVTTAAAQVAYGLEQQKKKDGSKATEPVAVEIYVGFGAAGIASAHAVMLQQALRDTGDVEGSNVVKIPRPDGAVVSVRVSMGVGMPLNPHGLGDLATAASLQEFSQCGVWLKHLDLGSCGLALGDVHARRAMSELLTSPALETLSLCDNPELVDGLSKSQLRDVFSAPGDSSVGALRRLDLSGCALGETVGAVAAVAQMLLANATVEWVNLRSNSIANASQWEPLSEVVLQCTNIAALLLGNNDNFGNGATTTRRSEATEALTSLLVALGGNRTLEMVDLTGLMAPDEPLDLPSPGNRSATPTSPHSNLVVNALTDWIKSCPSVKVAFLGFPSVDALSSPMRRQIQGEMKSLQQPPMHFANPHHSIPDTMQHAGTSGSRPNSPRRDAPKRNSSPAPPVLAGRRRPVISSTGTTSTTRMAGRRSTPLSRKALEPAANTRAAPPASSSAPETPFPTTFKEYLNQVNAHRKRNGLFDVLIYEDYDAEVAMAAFTAPVTSGPKFKGSKYVESDGTEAHGPFERLMGVSAATGVRLSALSKAASNEKAEKSPVGTQTEVSPDPIGDLMRQLSPPRKGLTITPDRSRDPSPPERSRDQSPRDQQPRDQSPEASSEPSPPLKEPVRDRSPPRATAVHDPDSASPRHAETSEQPVRSTQDSSVQPSHPELRDSSVQPSSPELRESHQQTDAEKAARSSQTMRETVAQSQQTEEAASPTPEPEVEKAPEPTPQPEEEVRAASAVQPASEPAAVTTSVQQQLAAEAAKELAVAMEAAATAMAEAKAQTSEVASLSRRYLFTVSSMAEELTSTSVRAADEFSQAVNLYVSRRDHALRSKARRLQRYVDEVESWAHRVEEARSGFVNREAELVKRHEQDVDAIRFLEAQVSVLQRRVDVMTAYPTSHGNVGVPIEQQSPIQPTGSGLPERGYATDAADVAALMMATSASKANRSPSLLAVAGTPAAVYADLNRPSFVNESDEDEDALLPPRKNVAQAPPKPSAMVPTRSVPSSQPSTPGDSPVEARAARASQKPTSTRRPSQLTQAKLRAHEEEAALAADRRQRKPAVRSREASPTRPATTAPPPAAENRVVVERVVVHTTDSATQMQQQREQPQPQPQPELIASPVPHHPVPAVYPVRRVLPLESHSRTRDESPPSVARGEDAFAMNDSPTLRRPTREPNTINMQDQRLGSAEQPGNGDVNINEPMSPNVDDGEPSIRHNSMAPPATRFFPRFAAETQTTPPSEPAQPPAPNESEPRSISTQTNGTTKTSSPQREVVEADEVSDQAPSSTQSPSAPHDPTSRPTPASVLRLSLEEAHERYPRFRNAYGSLPPEEAEAFASAWLQRHSNPKRQAEMYDVVSKCIAHDMFTLADPAASEQINGSS